MTDDEVEAATKARAVAADNATGWFETLYADAAAGRAVVPWDRDEPQRLLVRWVSTRQPVGAGRPALVVGAGTGADAEYVASLGYAVTAFDVSPTAVRTAGERHPATTVGYVVADLLDPPAEWSGAFALVVESLTVQSLPRTVRARITATIRSFVAPGGTLVVVASRLADTDPPDQGPPWLLDDEDIAAFGGGGDTADGLVRLGVEPVPRPAPETGHVWLAEFHRPI